MDPRIIEAYATVQRGSQTMEGPADAVQILSEEELEQGIQLCKSRISAGRRAYEQTTALYRGLFGMPAACKLGGGEVALREAEKVFFDPALRKLLFEPQTGFLAKKPKAADYNRFCCSAQVLQEYYSERLFRLEQRRKELTGRDRPKMERIRAGIENARANVVIGAEHWNVYPPLPQCSKELYLGDLEVPVEADAAQPFRRLGIVEGDEWLQLPFTYNVYKPFSTLISYKGDTREGEVKLGNMIRSLMYQIIRVMPPYSYEFIFLDPTHGGATLRELLTELGGVVDGNAYRLHQKLYPDCVYRMLTVAGTRERVRQELEKLENRIAVINGICGGQSVAQFNAAQFAPDGQIVEDNTGVIPQVFVFYENVHGILDSRTTEILQKLADCADIAGITLVATSVREENQSLTPEEQLLLREGQIRDDLDHIEIQSEGAGLYVDADTMGESANKNLFFNFQPCFEDIRQEEFLKLVSKCFRPSLEKETAYEKRIDLDSVWGKSDGSREICIPVAVNQRDKVVYLKLGGPSAAHALLAGTTGCGKSSFLHTIISGVITHYKPTDVQLWLSDYKTAEFRRYMKNTPPHVAYVGIARTPEYTLSFIDKLCREYERRLRAFETCTSVEEYRRLHGPDSMPRILIVVDEFHEMSDHVKEFPDYKTKLAYLLRETRAVGMTFLLADQTCGVGLQGLREDGKLQLTCRMAMRTSTAEYNAAFDITNAKEVIPTQGDFEVVLKRLTTQIDSMGKPVVRTYYEHCKTLFVHADRRGEIARKSIQLYGSAPDPMFVMPAERINVDWEEIEQEEAKMPAQRGVPVWMGVPVTLERFFQFRLMANYGENVVNVVPKEEILSSLFIMQLDSVRRQGNCEIYVIANENDSQFCFCEPWLNRQAAADPHIHIVTYIGDICSTVMQLREDMIRRRRMRGYGRIAVFWMGLFDITLEMGYLKADRPAGESSGRSGENSLEDSVDSLNAQFEALFRGAPGMVAKKVPERSEYSEGEVDDSLYNATGDIAELLQEGPKRSIHSFCYYTAVNIALKTKCAPLSGDKASFTHKIGMCIGKEESLDYFGAARLCVDAEGNALSDEVAVYYNGRSSTQFMPFIGEAENDYNEQQKS